MSLLSLQCHLTPLTPTQILICFSEGDDLLDATICFSVYV